MSLTVVAAPVVAASLVAGAGGMVVATDLELLRDRGLRVLAPADGARVGEGFLLRWSGAAEGRYAVVVDAAVPRPGAGARAGDHLVLVTGTSVRLTLGPRHEGSPSARRHHEVAVVPLDHQGRRVGEAVAVVRVRA